MNKEPKIYDIVVLAHKGTKALVAKAWAKFAPCAFKVVEVSPDTTIQSFITEKIITAEIGVSDNFILVPANCIPCDVLNQSELFTPVVYVAKTLGAEYASPLPKVLSLEKVTEALGAQKEPVSDEQFLADYYSNNYPRAMHVAHSYGNYVCCVRRAQPNLVTVADCLRARKYLSATAEGWNAAAEIIKEYLAELG